MSEHDYELVKQALLRRHDLDPDGLFDAETDEALVALERLAMSVGPVRASFNRPDTTFKGEGNVG